MKFSIKDFSSKCYQKSHFPMDLVTLTGEIFNEKLHFVQYQLRSAFRTLSQVSYETFCFMKIVIDF